MREAKAGHFTADRLVQRVAVQDLYSKGLGSENQACIAECKDGMDVAMMLLI